MSMVNAHGVMPASAAATGTGTAVTASTQSQGTLGSALLWLGVALLVLTAIFALAAIRGLLPSRRSDTS